MKPKRASVLRTKVFVAVVLIATPCVLLATSYRSQKSGEWTATGDEGIWNIANSYPNSESDGVQIYAGHVVTLSGDATVKNLHLYGTLQHSSGTLSSPSPGETWKVYGGGLYDMTGGSLSVNVSNGLELDSDAEPSTTLFRVSGSATANFPKGLRLNGGTFEVAGGTPTVGGTVFLPRSDRGSGRFLFRDVKATPSFKLQLADVSRKDAAGTLAFDGATIAFTNAYEKWTMTTRAATNNSAVIEIANSSRVWFAGADSTHPSLPLMTNGDANNGSTFLVDVKNGSTLLVGGSYNAAGFGDDSIWTSLAPAKDNYNDLYIRNGATVKVDATSTLKVRRQLFGAAGGKLVIDGGRVECFYFGTEDSKTTAYTTPFRVDMTGGTLSATGDAELRIGGDAYTQTNRGNMCPVVFTQTGGVVSNATTGIAIATGSAGNVGRYVMAGGSIGAGMSVTVESGYGELVFKGSAFDGRISGANGISTSGGLVEFVLDKSPSHITNVYVSEQKAYVGGHLRVALDGGVLLTEPTEFLLMEKKSGTGRDLTYNDSKSYASTPDGTLWTTALDSSKLKVTATMSAALGTLPADGETDFGPDSPSAAGSVQMTQLLPGQQLAVSMRVRDAEGNVMAQSALDSLVARLVAAGYTNSTADASAEYNLTAVVPGECVTAASERFAWDFTVNSVRDITTNGTTRVLAKVEGLKAVAGIQKRGLVISFR